MKREKKIPGVTWIREGEYEIRGKYIDKNTGKVKHFEPIIRAGTAAEANAERIKRIEEGQGFRVGAEAAPERRSFGATLSAWLTRKAPKIRKSTRPKYESAVKAWAAAPGENGSALGDYWLDRVTPADVERALYAWREAGIKTSTINTRLNSLRTFATDEKCRQIVDGVSELQRTLGEIEASKKMGGRGLSEDELRRVITRGPVAPLLIQDRRGRSLTTIPEWWHAAWAFVATLFWCGLRFSEITALRWPDIDFQAGVIRVMRRQWRGDLAPPKTEAGFRDPPMNSDLVLVLQNHRERLRAAGHDVENGPAFPGRKGNEFISHRFATRILRMVYAAAEIDLRGRPTIHAARHTANNLIRRAAPEEVRRAILGGAADADTRLGASRELSHAIAEAARARIVGHSGEVRTYTHVAPSEAANVAEYVARLITGRDEGGRRGDGGTDTAPTNPP